MLVFRCECDTVLGVDNESSKGGLGECPSCGKIIRVPAGLVNATGKLRLASPPQRASGSYRLIKDVKPEGAKNGPGSGIMNATLPSIATPAVSPKPTSGVHTPRPPSAPMPTHVPAPETMAEDLAEPETLAPLTDSALNRPVTDSAPLPAVEAAAEEVPPDAPTEMIPPAPHTEFTSSDTAIRTKDSLAKKPTRSTKVAAKSDLKDPNAVVDVAAATAITPAQGSSSRRRRAEAVAPAKKNPIVLAAAAIALAAVVVLVLWWLGYLGGETPKSNSGTPKAPATKTDTSDKKPDTKSTVTTDKPNDTAKPPDASDQKLPADGEKKNEK
ncbi:MAG TPA: hypothetical protein VKX17_15550 [Planctomycetota bacterium]|nr:hypothetical protein [Planctomycetota bacterium]